MNVFIEPGDIVSAWSSVELKMYDFLVVDVRTIKQFDLSRGPFRMFTTDVTLVRKGGCNHIPNVPGAYLIFNDPRANFCWMCGEARPT